MAAAKKNLTTAEQQANARHKPQTINDMAPDEELTPEEEAALEDAAQNSGPAKLAQAMNPKSAMVQGAPPWANVPADIIIPRGVEVAYMKIPLRDPEGAETQIVLWELGVRDERMARARTQGDMGTRLVDEMAKQMIRVVDGVSISWANPLIVEKTWESIGSKYRNLLVAWYLKAHQLEDEERVDFFANRVVAKRAV